MKFRKVKYKCLDGPFKGQYLWLSACHPQTMLFRIGNDRGSYCRVPYPIETTNVCKWHPFPHLSPNSGLRLVNKDISLKWGIESDILKIPSFLRRGVD